MNGTRLALGTLAAAMVAGMCAQGAWADITLTADINGLGTVSSNLTNGSQVALAVDDVISCQAKVSVDLAWQDVPSTTRDVGFRKTALLNGAVIPAANCEELGEFDGWSDDSGGATTKWGNLWGFGEGGTHTLATAYADEGETSFTLQSTHVTDESLRWAWKWQQEGSCDVVIVAEDDYIPDDSNWLMHQTDSLTGTTVQYGWFTVEGEGR